MKCNSYNNIIKHLQDKNIISSNFEVLNHENLIIQNNKFIETIRNKYNIHIDKLFSVTNKTLTLHSKEVFNKIDNILNNKEIYDENTDHDFSNIKSNNNFENIFNEFSERRKILLDLLYNKFNILEKKRTNKYTNEVKFTDLVYEQSKINKEIHQIQNYETELLQSLKKKDILLNKIKYFIKKDNERFKEFLKEVQIDASNVKSIINFNSFNSFRDKLVKQLEFRKNLIKVEKKSKNIDKNKLINLEKIIIKIDDEILKLTEQFKLNRNYTIEEYLHFYTKNDFKILEKIHLSENIKDIELSKEIISFYKKIGTFDIKKDNPLFIRLFDENGEIVIPDNIIKKLIELKNNAELYENKIISVEKKIIVNKIKNITQNNPKYTSISHYSIDEFYNKIFNNDQLKDTSLIDMYLSSPDTGITSSNDIIPSVLSILLENSINENLSKAKDIEAEVDEILPDVESTLKEMGYGFENPLLKGVNFDLFRSKNKYGQYKDALTQRFSIFFYEKFKNSVIDKFETIKNIDPIEKNNDRVNSILKSIKKFLKKHTYIIHPGALPEIKNDPEYKIYEKYFYEDENYINDLKRILGEKGYLNIVDEQKKEINKYKLKIEAFKEQSENFIDEEFEIDNNYNPFKVAENFKKDINIKNINYNIFIPKDKIDGKETNYYDEDFKIIEKNENLLKFHTLLNKVQSRLFESLPEDIKDKFNYKSLPSLKKVFIELLFENNNDIISNSKTISIKYYDKLKQSFGENLNEDFSYNSLKINEESKINISFLRSNKKLIDQNLEIEIQRIKKSLGISFIDSIPERIDITNNEDLINIISENLQIDPNIDSIKNILFDKDLKNLKIEEILKDAITNQIVKDNSFDLPKIIKLFTYLIEEYNAKQKVLPTLNILKNHYKEIKIKDKQSGIEILRNNAINQIDSWYNRVILGDYSSKNELENTGLKRFFTLKFNEDEKSKLFLSKLSTVIDGRILSHEEKIVQKKIKENIDSLEEEIKNDKWVDKGDNILAKDLLFKMKNAEKEIGKNYSIKAHIDAIFNFIKYTALGWNIDSYITNFLAGQSANLVSASSGIYFTPENIHKANSIIKESFLKTMTFGLKKSPDLDKAIALEKKFRVIQDNTNELQKASIKSAFYSDVGNLASPFEGMKRTEFLNQIPLMISILMDIKIKDKNGKNNILWDSINSDGNLKEEFQTEENIENWENLKGDQYNKFKLKINKAIINTHGDYFKRKGNLAKEFITGKAILMFKGWMPRQFYQRYAVEQEDLELGEKIFKGRYRSHTRATGTLHGAIIGFGGLSLLGAGGTGLLAGGALGFLGSKFYGVDSSLSYLKEMSLVGKEIILTMLKIPVNNLTGKNIIKESNLDELDISEIDLNNLRANLVDMSITLGWLSLIIFTKMLLWDDDDEDDDTRRQTHNLFINKFMNLSSESSMYLNPVDGWDNTLGSIAPLRFFQNVGKTAIQFENYIAGNDTILTGPNEGQSKLYKQFEKTFLPKIVHPGFGLAKPTTRQYQEHPFDSWFISDQKQAKIDIRVLKLEAISNYIHSDMSVETQEKIKKKIDNHFKKRKDETYVESLQRIKIFKF